MEREEEEEEEGEQERRVLFFFFSLRSLPSLRIRRVLHEVLVVRCLQIYAPESFFVIEDSGQETISTNV